MGAVTVEVEMKRREWIQDRIRRINKPCHWMGYDEQKKEASKSEAWVSGLNPGIMRMPL